MKERRMESKNLNLRVLANGGRKQNTEIVTSKGNRRSNDVGIRRQESKSW